MKSLFKLSRAAGFANTKTKPTEVSYTIFGKGSKCPSCVFTVGNNIRKQMRWIPGDRVDILYDEALAEGQIIRVREGGWQVGEMTKDDSPARVRVSYRSEFGLPMVDEKLDLAVQLTDNTICFAFPTKYRKAVELPQKGAK